MFTSIMRKLMYRLQGNMIRDPKTVSKDVLLEAPVRVDKHTMVGANVRIGRYTYINSGFIGADTTIGRFCSIARGVIIGPDDHPTKWFSTSPFQYARNDKLFRSLCANTLSFERTSGVHIGNDVWIGANAFIKRGIHIGNGAIIGAGAVVIKNVPDYAIVGGNPAKIIKHRFDDTIIQSLVSLQWWNLDVHEIRALPFDNINRAVDALVTQRHLS